VLLAERMHSEGNSRSGITATTVFGVIAILLAVYLFVDSRLHSSPVGAGSTQGYDQDALLTQFQNRIDEIGRRVDAIGKDVKTQVVTSAQDLKHEISSSQGAINDIKAAQTDIKNAVNSKPTPPAPAPAAPTNGDLEHRKWFSTIVAIETPGPLLRNPSWDGPQSPINVEDRSYIIPMARFINCTAPVFPHRFLFDLGTAHFASSVGWMLENYPCEFDAIYGWEVRPNVFVIPDTLPEKIKNSIHFDNKYVGTVDGPDRIDFPAFLKRIVRKEDYVVLKMDIEGEEWNLIPALERSGAHELIDEFFVEIHFKHPLMSYYGWDVFSAHTLDEARALLNHWRYDLGVPSHYWP
jgi:hypothetical protein